MSAATKIPVADDVKLKFDSPTVQTLVLAIRNEKIELVEVVPSLGSPTSDFNGLKTKCNDEPRFFLFRAPRDARRFWCISYIPDAAPVSAKMLYAATKFVLLNVLACERLFVINKYMFVRADRL